MPFHYFTIIANYELIIGPGNIANLTYIIHGVESTQHRIDQKFLNFWSISHIVSSRCDHLEWHYITPQTAEIRYSDYYIRQHAFNV